MSKSMLVRQLVPTKVHFDGYDLVGCQARDRPFFGDNSIPMGKYTFTVRRIDKDRVSLEFQSVCEKGRICFEPYLLTFDEFVNKLKTAVKTVSDFIPFEITPVFDMSVNFCTHCSSKTIDCSRMNNVQPKTVMAAVSFDIDDIRRALAGYHEIINTSNKNGGKIKMKKNNFMGVKFEFGMSKDPNLAATLLGVAVRNSYGGSWYTYDPAKKVHKNLANVKMGNFPIYLLPVNKMQPGDLIKRNGEYFWIQDVTADGTFKAIGALDGLVHEILPTESLIPGLNLYTKVVAMDMKSLTDPSGNSVAGNLLSAMLLMQWSKNDGKAEFSLDDINDDSFNGMGAMLQLILAQSGGSNLANIFGGEDGKVNLPMLMMLSGSDSDESGFMQMYVLSQLLNGGGNTGLEGLIPGLSGPQKMTAPAAGVDTGNEVICDTCGITYPEGTNFCPKCGGKTHPVGVYCKKCGAQLMPGAAFCHKCGSKVGPATCPNCGNEVPEDAAFCPKCGTGLKAETVTPTAPVAPEIPEAPVKPDPAETT